MNKSKKPTQKVVKAWWVRVGKMDFSFSQLYRNYRNAKLIAGRVEGTKVIPVEIHYKI